MSAANRSNAGFSLVELLVVIVIIAILLALALPALQGVRETGRRAGCSRKLAALALATSQHDERLGFIPGWKNRSPIPIDKANRNWLLLLLPFLDRKDVLNQLDGMVRWATADWEQKGRIGAPPMYGPALASLDLVICPSHASERGYSLANHRFDKPNGSYAANVGGGSNRPHRATNGTVNAPNKWDGVMLDTTITTGPNAGSRSHAEISARDGLSSTLLFSERSSPLTRTMNIWGPSSFTFGGPGMTDVQPSAASPEPVFGLAPGTGNWGADPSDGSMTGRIRIINNSTHLAAPGYLSQPVSQHVGGVVASFCDGHTAFLREDLLASTYALLLSVDDELACTRGAGSGAYSIWATGTRRLKEADYR
jgi:prepilin-type N-terminal cleavage/methylation domain-containing protein